MKKIMALLVVLVFLACKEDVVKKPNRLIEKEVMINIMYDLSLFDAIKYQSPAVLDSNHINPRKYIFKKYKIDSLQFAKSNIYYASDYKSYKLMFEEITKRLDQNKAVVEALINAEKKKKEKSKSPIKKNLKKTFPPEVRRNDSLEINQRARL
jgi:Domain of unknown function (DUF4296)